MTSMLQNLLLGVVIRTRVWFVTNALLRVRPWFTNPAGIRSTHQVRICVDPNTITVTVSREGSTIVSSTVYSEQ